MKLAKVFLGVCILLGACQNTSRQLDRPVNGSHSGDHQDREAILELLQRESTAFWNKDFDGYARCWAHGEYIRTMGWWKTGGISITEGWETQAERVQSLMEEYPETNPTASRVRRENMNLLISGNMAWCTFDQYGEDTGDTAMDMPGRSRETRIFEKHDGEWKIVYVGWLLEE